MFFNALLNKIPFIRNRRIKKIKKDLIQIKEYFRAGYFNDQYVAVLHSIVNNPLVTFSEGFDNKFIGTLELRTKTSERALKLFNNKIYTRVSLEKSSNINMEMKTIYFSEWYSNEDSVNNFIESIKPYIALQAVLSKNPNYESQERIDQLTYGNLDMEFFDTLLYRLLLEDIVNIVSFYLEIQYE